MKFPLIVVLFSLTAINRLAAQPANAHFIYVENPGSNTRIWANVFELQQELCRKDSSLVFLFISDGDAPQLLHCDTTWIKKYFARNPRPVSQEREIQKIKEWLFTVLDNVRRIHFYFFYPETSMNEMFTGRAFLINELCDQARIFYSSAKDLSRKIFIATAGDSDSRHYMQQFRAPDLANPEILFISY